MRIVLIVAISIALCSCRSKNAAPEPDAAQKVKVKEKENSSTITLDREPQQKGHIVVESLQTKDVAESTTAPGQLTVNEDRTWHVGAIAAGKIDNLTARVGDRVRAGQILGRIHSHDVHEARAGYQQASVELKRAQAAEAYAKRLRERAQRLLELKAGSRQDLETAEAEVRNSQAAIEKAQSEVVKERSHLTDILHIPVDDEASNSKASEQDGIPIFAPASGVVLERKATIGSVVSASDELFTLSNTGSLWMIAAANEVDLSRLRPGQTVRISVRAYPDREFPGRVLKLGEQLDAATRTLQIRILVPNPQGLLKPEMYATANLQEGGKRPVLLLPQEAIQDINGVSAVFMRLSANEFEPRTIKTGRHINKEIEIVEGLKPGDAVVIKGSFVLKSQLLRRTLQEN